MRIELGKVDFLMRRAVRMVEEITLGRGEGRKTSDKLWSHTKIQADSPLTDFFINHVRTKLKNLFALAPVTHVSELAQPGCSTRASVENYFAKPDGLRESSQRNSNDVQLFRLKTRAFSPSRWHFLNNREQQRTKQSFHSVERQQIKIHRQVFKSNFISSSWRPTVTVAFVQQRTHVRGCMP